MSRKQLKLTLSGAVAGCSLIAAMGAITPAMAQIEEIIVTSQRVEQSIQTIPISVTAFDADAMDRQQIEDFSDLQFNTPNVNFSKTNFGSGNFQIRAIGSASIAASGDGGVGMHMNEVPLRYGHTFDIEYYDVERVEVMRGPQGTLFGRNATGGAVNMITKKPVPGEWAMNVGASAANFDTTKLNGAVNIPLGESIALRVAATSLKRDGFTENLHTGNNIDGRDQYSWRASARWEMGERTTFDLMYQYFNEESSRQRASKQLCHRDPSALYGCLPDKLAFEFTNSQSSWPNLFASSLVVGPFLAIQGAPYDPANDTFGASGITNPKDMRQVNVDFDPIYNSEDKFYTYGLTHEFDNVTMHYIGSHMETTSDSRSDYNQAVADNSAPNPIALAAFPISASILFPNPSMWPTSTITSTGTGSVGGHVTYSDRPHSFDWSRQEASQSTHELRFQSDLDGDVNWLAGAFYMETEQEGDYYVNSSAFDYLAMLLGPIWLSGATGPATSPTDFDGFGMVAPMFNAETKDNTLETWALFGEAYFQVNDTFKITGGLRYTNDKKSVTNRSTGFDQTGVAGNCFTCVQAYAQAIADNPATLGLAAAIDGGGFGGLGLFSLPFDAPLAEPSVTQDDSWNATTGRLAFDWTPDWNRTDATLIYGSVSRGYKGGGFNPAGNAIATKGFDPEYITSYEFGIKNDFSEKFRWNLVGFFYDYEGLQVAKITDRSASNENVDATIYGLESEMLMAPNENWLFNLNLSYLNTEVGDFLSIDPRDVTAGRSDVAVIKDPTSGAQCVISENGGLPLDTDLGGGWTVLNAIAQAQADNLPYPLDPAGLPNFMLCNAAIMDPVLAGTNALLGGLGANYSWSAGVEQDLTGNELQNSPEYSLSFGAQHTKYLNNGSTITTRLDYFKQAAMWGRIYNQSPIDKIDSWGQLNASMTFSPEEGDWKIKAYIQNIMDDDNVTGMYVTDPASGLFTNVFILEPRIFGVSVDFNF